MSGACGLDTNDPYPRAVVMSDILDVLAGSAAARVVPGVRQEVRVGDLALLLVLERVLHHGLVAAAMEIWKS